MQTTSKVLMIRPVDFKFNPETAENNKFQQDDDTDHVQQKARKEFDALVKMLSDNDLNVMVVNDRIDPETPDSIFPNNWISLHDNGEAILYPMFSENRRLERRPDILEMLGRRFQLRKITDLSAFEEKENFLEGTGSLVLDRIHKIAYACLSARTHEPVIQEFCQRTGYSAIVFEAVDTDGFPIYHTNVMMSVGEKYAVVCLEAIPDLLSREQLHQSLTEHGKEVIAITADQMTHFAGNMLELKNKSGQSLLVMSEQAFLSLNEQQIKRLEKYSRLIYSPLYTIEKTGGGSARCMIAEIHLPDMMSHAIL